MSPVVLGSENNVTRLRRFFRWAMVLLVVFLGLRFLNNDRLRLLIPPPDGRDQYTKSLEIRNEDLSRIIKAQNEWLLKCGPVRSISFNKKL